MANEIFSDSIATLRTVFAKLEDEVVRLQSLEADKKALETNKAELLAVIDGLHKEIDAARLAIESDRQKNHFRKRGSKPAPCLNGAQAIGRSSRVVQGEGCKNQRRVTETFELKMDIGGHISSLDATTRL
jgi:hypothetical protein